MTATTDITSETIGTVRSFTIVKHTGGRVGKDRYYVSSPRAEYPPCVVDHGIKPLVRRFHCSCGRNGGECRHIEAVKEILSR